MWSILCKNEYISTTWRILTWEQGEGNRVDAVLLGGSCALRVGDIHLEFDWFLEDCRARCGLVLRSETGLRDHTVAQTGDLGGNKKSRGVSDKKKGLRGSYMNKTRQQKEVSNEIIHGEHWCLIFLPHLANDKLNTPSLKYPPHTSEPQLKL